MLQRHHVGKRASKLCSVGTSAFVNSVSINPAPEKQGFPKLGMIIASGSNGIDGVSEPFAKVVVASFECLIPGREGRGTDVMQFNEHLQVTGVAAIRHASVKS